MTCPNCQAASERLHHGYTNNCKGCQARAIARSPAFSDANKRQIRTAAYRLILGQFDVTHEAVLDAVAADFLNKPNH